MPAPFPRPIFGGHVLRRSPRHCLALGGSVQKFINASQHNNFAPSFNKNFWPPPCFTGRARSAIFVDGRTPVVLASVLRAQYFRTSSGVRRLEVPMTRLRLVRS